MQKKLKSMLRSNAMRWMLVCGAQIWIFAVSGLTAFLLRFDFNLPPICTKFLAFALPIWIVAKSITFHLANLNRRGLRYVTISDVYRLIFANLLGSAISSAIILFAGPAGFPRSIYLSDLILSFLGTTGLRIVVRMAVEAMQNGHSEIPGKRTLIYGAGDAGITLLREIRNNSKLAYDVLGFIDDDREKIGLHIGGIPVLGAGNEIETLASDHEIETILIAIPSANGFEMTRILEHCHTAQVECKTVPGLGEIIEDGGLVGQIREVAVEDLLGRTPVHLSGSQISNTLEGRMVLVTGAAGSIGSELCRQIARYSPAGIVGFEVAESPLFEIDREMKLAFPHVPFFPEIGNIQNRNRLSEVFSKYRPAVVYHAAAYKHVPLMETHIFEAIENNVFGTFNVAETAMQHHVEEFVMISSDKAVRPTNVMGASKRIAELILLALQNGGTQFIAVRFGNVLGSSGSVIPIFKKQIASGGPVTVTHPEMRRFFMTIPEACQLVLQASAIGKGGQICVLDMGKPVKIVQLARNLIRLSGLQPDKDIAIKFTGIRPGEKLFEELSSLLEDTVPTEHEKVRIFVGNGVPDCALHTWLETLREISEARDVGRLLVAMKDLVPDYNPSSSFLKRAIFEPTSDFQIPLVSD